MYTLTIYFQHAQHALEEGCNNVKALQMQSNSRYRKYKRLLRCPA
jgi:putative ribosome biogenesis GTPase RsgA